MAALGVTTLGPWLHVSFMQKCKLILLPLKSFAEIKSVQIECHTVYHTSLRNCSRPAHESKAHLKNRRNFFFSSPKCLYCKGHLMFQKICRNWRCELSAKFNTTMCHSLMSRLWNEIQFKKLCQFWLSVVPEIGTQFGLSDTLPSKKHEAS